MKNLTTRLFYGSTVLLIITGTTSVWGEAIGLSLFIHHIGLKPLPLVIILEALLTALLIFTLEQVKRYMHDALLVASIGAMGIALILLGRALATQDVKLGFGLLYFAQSLLRDLLQFYTWRYVLSYYMSRSRHQVPQIILHSRIGTVFGGLALTVLTLFFDPLEMLWVWIGALLFTIASLGIYADELSSLSRQKEVTSKLTSQIAVQFRNALQGYFASRMIRLLSVSAFCLLFATTLMFYQAADVFNTTFHSETALLRWFGVSNLVGLVVIPLFWGLMTYAIKRVNLAHVSEGYAALVGVGFLGVYLFPNLLTALFGELTRAPLLYSFYTPVKYQIRNVLPSSLQLWSHSFGEGMVESGGRVLAGILLWLFISFNVPMALLVIIGVATIGGFAWAYFRAIDLYQTALDQSLAAGQYGFLRQTRPEHFSTDQHIVNELLNRLKSLASTDRDILVIGESLAETGSEEAFTALADLWWRSPSNSLQAELLLLLADGWSSRTSQATLRALIVEALDSQDSKLCRAALRAITQYPHLQDTRRVADLLLDQDPTVSTLAAQLLLQHPSPELAQAAYGQLKWLSGAGKASTRALAVNALVAGSMDRYEERTINLAVEEFQQDPAARVRMAIVPVANRQQLLTSAQDISPAVRQLAVGRLKKQAWRNIRLLKARLAQQRLTTPYHYQITGVIRYWHLLTALASLAPRYGRQILLDELTLGLKHIDYLAALGLALRNLRQPVFASVITQLQLDRAQVIEAVLNFLGEVQGKNRVSSIVRTLQTKPSEVAYQQALEDLHLLTSEPIAQQFCHLLTADRHAFPLVTNAPAWQPHKPQEVLRVLLTQEDDWFSLLVLYTLSALPSYSFEQLTDRDLIQKILERGRHSPDDTIREGIWHLRRALQPHLEGTQPPPIEEKQMLSTIERMVFLRKVHFFENLRLDQLRSLARICEEWSVTAGEIVIHKGEAGDSLLIVVEGSINVVSEEGDQEVVISHRESGEVLGETSFFDGGLRSANARAATPALLLVVYRDTLYNALADDPAIAMDMLRAMAQLIRSAHQEVGSLTRQIRSRQVTASRQDRYAEAGAEF